MHNLIVRGRSVRPLHDCKYGAQIMYHIGESRYDRFGLGWLVS